MFQQFSKETSSIRHKLLFFSLTLSLAIIERSFFPFLLLFPLFKQQDLNENISSQLEYLKSQYSQLSHQYNYQIIGRLESLESEYNNLSHQYHDLTSSLEDSQQQTIQLVKKINSQQTRQNLHLSALQKLQNQSIQQKFLLAQLLNNSGKISSLSSTFKDNNILVLIDSANLDHAFRHLNIQVDYQKFKKILSQQVQSTLITNTPTDNLLNIRYYIGEDPQNKQQQKFFKCLCYLGYTIVSKPIIWQQGKPKANVDVDLAVDLLELGINYKIIILCSGDGDYLKAVTQMQEKGVKIMVVSLYSMTSKLLKTTADQYLDLEKIKEQIVYDDCNLVA